MILRSILYFNK